MILHYNHWVCIFLELVVLPELCLLLDFLAAVRSKSVVLLSLICCLLLLILWESDIVLCFVVCCFMSIQVLHLDGEKRAGCFA